MIFYIPRISIADSGKHHIICISLIKIIPVLNISYLLVSIGDPITHSLTEGKFTE